MPSYGMFYSDAEIERRRREYNENFFDLLKREQRKVGNIITDTLPWLSQPPPPLYPLLRPTSEPPHTISGLVEAEAPVNGLYPHKRGIWAALPQSPLPVFVGVIVKDKQHHFSPQKRQIRVWDWAGGQWQGTINTKTTPPTIDLYRRGGESTYRPKRLTGNVGRPKPLIPAWEEFQVGYTPPVQPTAEEVYNAPQAPWPPPLPANMVLRPFKGPESKQKNAVYSNQIKCEINKGRYVENIWDIAAEMCLPGPHTIPPKLPAVHTVPLDGIIKIPCLKIPGPALFINHLQATVPTYPLCHAIWVDHLFFGVIAWREVFGVNVERWRVWAHDGSIWSGKVWPGFKGVQLRRLSYHTHWLLPRYYWREELRGSVGWALEKFPIKIPE